MLVNVHTNFRNLYLNNSYDGPWINTAQCGRLLIYHFIPVLSGQMSIFAGKRSTKSTQHKTVKEYLSILLGAFRWVPMRFTIFQVTLRVGGTLGCAFAAVFFTAWDPNGKARGNPWWVFPFGQWSYMVFNMVIMVNNHGYSYNVNFTNYMVKNG